MNVVNRGIHKKAKTFSPQRKSRDAEKTKSKADLSTKKAPFRALFNEYFKIANSILDLPTFWNKRD